MDIQIELYMNELKTRVKKNKVIFSVEHCIIFLVLIFIIIILSISYFSFLRQKANYFYIFYGIGIETIHSLVNKCESFLLKLNKEQKKLIEEKEDEDDEESSLKKPKLKFAQSIIIDHNYNNYNIVSPNKGKGKGINHITLHQKISKENDIYYKCSSSLFITNISIIFSIILIYLIIVINDYFSFLTRISEYALYIIKLSEYQNDIIGLFNGYREFLFDQNTMINGKISNDYINDKLNEIYLTKFDDNIIFNKYRNKIPNFLQKYKELNENNPCSILRNNSYFNSEEDCLIHMYGIASYGLSIIHTSMTEEIRIHKNIVNMLLNNNLIKGNLTLYGSIFWSDENIKNELKNSNNSNITNIYYRVYLFNNNSLHKDLNILFINLVYPFLDEERELTVDSINNAIKNKEITYIIFFTSLLVVITLSFLFYLLPMIKRMNNTIYKTKKMLSIIPIHILASQENITGLLNLEIDANYKPNDNLNNIE